MLLANVDLSTVELLKFSLIWNAEHIHILPKGLLCILIFYVFYSSKREKKQVEVIEAARCWWHPFHCNDSHDLRFCLALLCLWIANLQVATATLYTDMQASASTLVIISILFALLRSTPKSPLHGGTRVWISLQSYSSSLSTCND